MYFKTIALFGLLGSAVAKPAPKVLSHDDVIVLRSDGHPVIMKEWEYSIEEAKSEVKRRKALGQAPRTIPAKNVESNGLERRCDESTEVQVLTDTSFNNWDVAMSPVIGNTGSESASIAVTKGYSVSNSVSVTATASATLYEILSLSLSVSYTDTWTTEDSQTFTFGVPAGQYGVVISNPYVHRLAGNVISGCTDSPTVDTFQSDSYTSEQYGELSWVTGPIRLCNSTTYPIPYCTGTGTHA